MSKRTWLVIAVVLGGGILLQIPSWGGHREHHAGDGHDHPASMQSGGMAASVSDDAVPGSRTVALEVTGMT